jgi:hypothetical protein
MKSLRRPAVYQGVTYPDYEVELNTSNVYSVKFGNRILKPIFYGKGYLKYCFYSVGKIIRAKKHGLIAETFPDFIQLSPIVSHHGLKIGRERYELEFGTAFRMICNMVCPDHIDGNRVNNHHSNLMIVTQFENILKCGPRKGKYKGFYKTSSGTYQIDIQFENILDENGKSFRLYKRFKTEEEAALGFNTMIEEALLTIFGLDLGPKMYDFAYKNAIETPVQEQLILR